MTRVFEQDPIEREQKKARQKIPDFFGKDQLIADLEDEDKAYEVMLSLKKFATRYRVKYQYISKFKAFKLLQKETHVDWVTLKDLSNRYGIRLKQFSRIPNVQRPYEKARVY